MLEGSRVLNVAEAPPTDADVATPENNSKEVLSMIEDMVPGRL